jgi:hypothetical protein
LTAKNAKERRGGFQPGSGLVSINKYLLGALGVLGVLGG